MKIIRFLPLIILFASCSNKPQGNISELKIERDSLQKVLFETQKQLLIVEKAIAEKDTAINPHDREIRKKIIAQKNRIAMIEKNIRSLKNELSSSHTKTNDIPVAVKEMKPEPFNHYFFVFGNAEAKQYGHLSPEMPGRVETINVTEGQFVKKGTILLTLNTDAIKKQIKGVETNLDFAKETYKKQKALWDQKIGSEIQYLQAKATKEGLEAQLESLKAQLEMSTLIAPFDGIVDKIYPKVGEMASSQIPAIEFVNLDKIVIRAKVSEKYVDILKKGEKVRLTFASLPNYKRVLPIYRVSNIINPKSRTFEIELQIDNPNHSIKPNMISTIRVNDFSTENAFVMPSLAIKKDISGDYVYVVVKKDNKLIIEKRTVEPGMSYQDKTMIVKGLKQGDKVVTQGYNMVSTGIPVSIK